MGYISNKVSNKFISGTSNKDSIYNIGENVTINAAEGNDSINNIGYNVIIAGEAGNDSIENYADFVTIDGGAGDDVIKNDGFNVSISGGAGNDSIQNNRAYLTIEGGAGNDTIKNEGSSVTISGGDGNDSIEVNSYYLTIDGGKGDDTIKSYYSERMVFFYNEGDGNDLITGFRKDSRLIISGTYSTQKNGNDIIVTVGEGKITLEGAANLAKVNIMSTEDDFDSYTDDDTDADSDSDDDIDDDSYIYNDENNTVVNGSTGNDYIQNQGDNVTINAGKGSDSIHIAKDLISFQSNAENNIILYSSGDGNDTIRGFNSTSTLSISGDSYSTQKSGLDVLVKVGEETINLKNVYATADTIHINDESIALENRVIDLVSFYNSIEKIIGDLSNPVDILRDSVLVIGRDGVDVIDNHGSFVTIKGGGASDHIKSWWDCSKVVINGDGGDDRINNYGDSATINCGAGNDDVYSYGKFNSIVGGAGDDTIDNVCSDVYDEYEYVSISGGTGNDSISNRAGSVTIDAGKGNDKIYNGGYSVIITGADGNDSIENYGSSVSIEGGAGNDYIYNSWDANNVTIKGGDGNDTITNEGDNVLIDGGKGSNVINVDMVEEEVYVNVGNGANTINVGDILSLSVRNFGKDDVIDLGTTIENLEIMDWGFIADNRMIRDIGEMATVKNSWSIATNSISYNQKTSAGVRIDGAKVTYDDTSSSKKLFTITGINSSVGVSLEDKVVTISAAALKKSTVSISSGYTLALADDVTKTSTKAAGWSLSGTTATYKASSTSAGYKLADNKITYVKASGGKTLVTVKGVKSLDGISLKNKVVTVSKAALNKDTVSISSGYTLALADDVTKTSTKAAGWSLSGTTATYKAASTSAGYKLADNKITYVKASGGETLVTVKGVKSLDGISLKDKVVTVTASALSNNAKVTLSGSGYTLALDSNVTKTTTKKAWNLSGTTATYKQTTSAGYKLASDAKSISYTAAANKTLATVKGLKSGLKVSGGQINGVSVSGKVITLSKSVLGSSNVSISKGYTLALGSDVDTTKESVSKWATLSGGNVAYLKGITNSYYTLNKAKTAVTYVAAKSGTNKVELSGVKGTPTLKSGVVSLKANNFSSNVSVKSNAGGYSFSLSGNFKNKTFTGTAYADTITSSGSNIAIKGGKGNDSLVGGKNNDELYGGAGSDVLKGGQGNDSLWGGAGNDKLYGGSGDDVFIYKPGEGTDKIFNHDAGDMLKILKTNGKEGGTFTKATFSNGDLTLAISGGGTVILDGVAKGDKVNINNKSYTIKGSTLK